MITVNVTPQQYADLTQKLKEETGLELVGNSGTVEKSGVKASYSYDGLSTLQIDVISKPFLISKSAVENHLRDALAEQGLKAV